MDIKIRLTRKPLTTALWTILTAAMALLLSVGAAMMYSSGSLVDILDGYHTSIAVRTDRTNSEQETVLPNGALFSGIVYEDKSFDEQDAAYFESLDCVEKVYFHTMSAAHCPDFVPAISGMRFADFDECYEYIVLVGEVTELTGSVDYGAVYDPDRKDVGIYGVLHIEEILLQNGIDPETAVIGVVTNDFHLYRARLIAERQGLEIIGAGAELPWWWLTANYYMREAFALVKTLLFDV